MLDVLQQLGEIQSAYVPEIAEKLRSSRSKKVLREFVGDLLAWTQDLSGEDLARIDERFASMNLPTLTSMRDRQFRRLVELIERGNIRSEEEYRLLHERLNDVGPTAHSEALRVRAEQMLGACAKTWSA